MLFKLTHIDIHGRRHRAKVTGRNVGDAIDQMEQEFGEAKALAAMRVDKWAFYVVPAVPGARACCPPCNQDCSQGHRCPARAQAALPLCGRPQPAGQGVRHG